MLVTLRPEPLARALGSADTELELRRPALPEPPALPEIPGLEALAELNDEVEHDPDPETIPEPGRRPDAPTAAAASRPAARSTSVRTAARIRRILLCPECRTEVEPGWKHCVSCGRAVSEA